MFYVYEWYIVETGEIIYVGKGCRNRYKTTQHNKFFRDMIKRYHCESRIIKEFESESEAYTYEHERTAELRAIGQGVCNIYLGGTGGSTEWWTDERRKEYSERNVMKAESQRKRMREHNPMKDKEISKRVGQYHAKPVHVNGISYPSAKEASKHFNVSNVTIINWCKRGHNPAGQLCGYINETQKSHTHYKYGNQQPSQGNSNNSTLEGSTTNG